jgi:hypothetical protein
MQTTLKAAGLLAAACLWLAGCASAPKLGQADTKGFNAGNATVLVDYTLQGDKDSDAQELAEERVQRVEELQQMLKGHGFKPVTGGTAAFRVRVVESADKDVTGEWTGAIGVNVALFTLGVVPAVFDIRNDFQYELWAGDKRVHAIATPGDWKKPFGLISVSSTLSGADAAKRKARTGAHDSVIRLWIDQGSFE